MGERSHLVAEAAFLLRRGPVFRVDPRGHGRDREHLPEIHLDHAARFERRFVVRSLEPITTRELLDAPTRVRLMSLARRGRLGSRLRPHLSSDGKLVKLTFSGPVPPPEAMTEAESLVGDLASYGRDALELIASIPGATLREAPDAPPYAISSEAPDVHFYPWAAAMGSRPFGRLSLVATTPRGEPGAEFRLPISDRGQVSADASHHHVPDDLVPWLKRVGPCILEATSSEVRMTWDIDAARPELLLDGARFITQLASSTTPPAPHKAVPGCC